MMHTEGDTWVCRSCENEAPRDSGAEAAMTTQDGQRDDGAPAVADATRDSNETMREPCPAGDCDGDRAYYEMMPKPGGSPTRFGCSPASSAATSGASPDYWNEPGSDDVEAIIDRVEDGELKGTVNTVTCTGGTRRLPRGLTLG